MAAGDGPVVVTPGRRERSWRWRVLDIGSFAVKDAMLVLLCKKRTKTYVENDGKRLNLQALYPSPPAT